MRHREKSIDNIQIIGYYKITMKYIKICIYIFVLILFSSCINRRAYIIPEKPYAFDENGVIFSVHYSKNFPTIFYSEPDNHGNVDRINEQIFIETNNSVDDVIISSYELQIDGLNIVIQDNKLNKDFWFYDNENMAFNKIYKYYGFVQIINITPDDLRRMVSENITLRDLYKKLHNVKNVRLIVKIKYKINEEEKTSILIWNYKIKFTLTNALWDAWMSI
jgi:hypothetical protein